VIPDPGPAAAEGAAGAPRISPMNRTWEGLPGGVMRPGASAGDGPFERLVDSVRDYAIFLLDEDGLIQSWNTGARLITGYAADEVIGRHFAVLYTPDEVERGWPQRTLAQAARHGRFQDEGWRLRRDGQRFWADVVATAILDDDGRPQGYSKILRDLTGRRQREEALQRTVERSRRLWTEAVKDPLTGAYNRRYMDEQLRGAVERAQWVTASLVAFDLDAFKAINDRFGHVAGDTVLVGVAALARRLSREGDLLFRPGGDEFVLYLPGTGAVAASGIAERLRGAVERTALIPQATATLSLGVAELRPGEDAAAWLARADQALYSAKRAGRNRVA
jgi:diguanylate cyclase (GGDEF)-like protein/PAS domain S-box-containing protein